MQPTLSPTPVETDANPGKLPRIHLLSTQLDSLNLQRLTADRLLQRMKQAQQHTVKHYSTSSKQPHKSLAREEHITPAGQMMMTASDRQNHLKEQARQKAVEESPLQNYQHEINHPFHLRKNSFKIWSTRLSPQAQAKCINFDAKPSK